MPDVQFTMLLVVMLSITDNLIIVNQSRGFLDSRSSGRRSAISMIDRVVIGMVTIRNAVIGSSACSSCLCSVSADEIRFTLQSRAKTYRSPLLPHNLIPIIIINRQPKDRRIDIPMSPKEQSTKAWFSEEVKDTVEDGFGVGSNDYNIT